MQIGTRVKVTAGVFVGLVGRLAEVLPRQDGDGREIKYRCHIRSEADPHFGVWRAVGEFEEIPEGD